MATDIVMPNMGFDAQVARVVEWLKQPGDPVRRGEVIAVIESDKANVELESVANGVLLETLVTTDDEVEVGAVIARVGAADEAEVDSRAEVVTPVVSVEASPLAKRIADGEGIDINDVTGSGPRGRVTGDDVREYLSNRETMPMRVRTNGASGVLALPKVRKAARDAGVDLAAVPATGSRGEVTLADLQIYLEEPSDKADTKETPVIEPTFRDETADMTEVEVSRMRRTIGERLQQSKRNAPHFYVTGEFDLEDALNRMEGTKAGVNDLLQYVTVQTLLQVPELNATYRDGRLYHHDRVNLAIAVALPNGLITPVLRNADMFSLTGMADASRDLIRRARDGRLKPEEIQGGTFTISNLGVVPQVEQFTAVINPPQVGILAAGTVKPRPVVVDGGLFVRRTVKLTVTGDHRVVDGMHLGQFLASFADELARV